MQISELYLHPLKSAAAISVGQLTYNYIGPIYDREWMLVDLNGAFISQRKHPKLCLLNVDVDDQQLRLNAQGMNPLNVALKTMRKNESTAHNSRLGSPIMQVTIWRDTVHASDCGDDAAQWLSEFLGVSCRLVKVNNDTARQVDTDYAKSGQLVGFADGFPSLIVSRESLDEFNTHLDAPIDMRRFRPNIVISGASPYAEDTWQRIRINNIEFDLVKPCSRCIMPSINPDTAQKEMAVNQVLLETRRRERATYFGQNALHHGEGQIRVGDAVELL